jgi:hypothetical protein
MKQPPHEGHALVKKPASGYAGVKKHGVFWVYEIRRRSLGIKVYKGGFLSALAAHEARIAHLKQLLG